ncbi:uncharacterized protein LOC126906970 isoform X4 [Daktulosphaira vitifoliae]|uniref:uncharacterized protein LOC126906970 isoform X4 n=1 Tax=Daktulosphaira vitifoliae TaxID=58002 RepID=UPI0021AA0FF8|nr:uncharacterized protein LOC126906970 isoform X4 [Daktulosphaira vitifoliae]
MFSKMYSFVLIVMCGCFFGDVFGNTFFIDTNGNINKYRTIVKNNFLTDADWILESHCFSSPEIYLKCGPLKLTFEEKKIILNYKGQNTSFEYNAQKTNKELNSFLEKIDRNIEFKIVKIQSSKLNNDTPICDNDTVYDVETNKHLYTIQNLSLWRYAKEDLVQTYFSTLPLTTLVDFINNSTIYESSVEYTIERTIDIMVDRTIKYAILLISYAFEAMKIRLSFEPYWSQINVNLDQLNNALIRLNNNNMIERGLFKLQYIQETYSVMYNLKIMAIEYIYKFLSSQEKKDYSDDLNQDNFTSSNVNEKHILPQYLLNKVFNGFPNNHKDEKFHVIPKKLRHIVEKFQKIISLINEEYTHILKIKF